MAQVGADQVKLEPSEIVVERRIVPGRRRMSLFAAIVAIAFVLTCLVVFAGYRLGLREATPFEKAVENIPSQP
jgi:hypothetical protein